MLNVNILLFPGINRENDMKDAVLSVQPSAKVDFVWHKDTTLQSPDLIIIPGGFSYGDYLRCGAMAAQAPIMKDILRHADKGTPILGVCNGFQILTEAGLLPGALTRNEGLKFICRHVHIKPANENLGFNDEKESKAPGLITVPVAHGEGRYVADEPTLKTLNDEQRIAFQYCNSNGETDHSSNPNGSVQNIAGVMSANKKILGMMPHPENAIRSETGHQDGLKFFDYIFNTLT
jgi:phosphoribosylformylglycinamidine synthase